MTVSAPRNRIIWAISRSVRDANESITSIAVTSTITPRERNLTTCCISQLRSGLIQQVVRLRSRGVIVDVTAMDVMDSFASRTLREIAHMIRLRGAETVIVGIQPEVAFAMVQLGLTLEGVATALDLEEGLTYLNQKFEKMH